MRKKENVRWDSYLFEVDGFKFRRLDTNQTNKEADWSLYSMSKSIWCPTLYILVESHADGFGVRFYYNCKVPVELENAAEKFCQVYLRLIYPWLEDEE